MGSLSASKYRSPYSANKDMCGIVQLNEIPAVHGDALRKKYTFKVGSAKSVK